ncbi:MAG: hypothetical protein RLZZ338_2650 [Cyanobacteriota bacterium]
MNIWIVTTGSSDVKLKTDKNWNHLYRSIRNQLNLSFSPYRPPNSDSEEAFMVPARITGMVYGGQLEEYYDDLTFPLWEAFSQQLKGHLISEQDQIVLILTDQSATFDADDKRQKKSPYWQDTCELKPILERYLQQKFPGVEIVPLILKPQEKPGLDDWDGVLNLVRDEFERIVLELQPDTVYVSHQASTPAISSAVQFESLTRFGSRVKFLISNEQDGSLTRFIDRSSYLKRIRRQEALALLNNFDYSGVYQLLKDDLEESNMSVSLEILEKLEMAMLWNYAKFQEFLERYFDLSSENSEGWWCDNWWRTAYEAAYLATIRLKQGNTVEAFFHAFRAVEGAFLEWGKQEFKAHIQMNSSRAYLQPSILCDPKNYFKEAKINPDKPEKNNSLGNLKLKFQDLDNRLNNQEKDKQKPKGEILYGTTLYRLFETQKPDSKNMPEYKRFTAQDGISDKRNKNFHQLEGLSKDDVFRDWEVDNLEEWEKRILTYLNFIAQPDLPQEFTSLEEASLMSKVHEKLVNTIASYQPE